MAAQDADLVVILTEWDEFRGLDLMKLAKNTAQRRMADLRNIYSPHDAKKAGFDAYDCVGRPSLTSSEVDRHIFAEVKLK